MTTTPSSPKLPEPLKVVAWLTSWPKDRVRPAGSIVNRSEPQQKFDCNHYDPLVRLSDAQASIQALEAEVAGLRAVLEAVHIDAVHFAANEFAISRATLQKVDAARAAQEVKP